MHDRAADPIGAASRAIAVAIESMTLLNIDLRIAQVRPRVEESVHLLLMLLRGVVVCAVLSASDAACPRSSAETAVATAAKGRRYLVAGAISFAFLEAFCEEGGSDFCYLDTIMKTETLETLARKLVAPGKGILAADESSGTIEKRLKSINVPSNEENRRMYREILFTTNGAGEFISGVILFDETIRQKTRDGRSFVEVLEQQGIVPGIKVDKGAKAMANFPGEKITEGLDGLRERLTEYRKLGARFAKWRAVITIGDGIPTRTCIDSNAEALARYAALCQECDLVPIVEPEVLMDGTHTSSKGSC